MAKARRFVVWYSAQWCGVARGGIAELEDGETFDMWMDEYGEGDDLDCEECGLRDLRDTLKRLEADSHWSSRIKAAQSIRDLAITDDEVAAAVETSHTYRVTVTETFTNTYEVKLPAGLTDEEVESRVEVMCNADKISPSDDRGSEFDREIEVL